jgi:amino acid transporter
MDLATIAARLLTVTGVLVALTNIIVQVLKQITPKKIPTNLLAVIVSLALTLLAFFAWASYTGTAIVWYMIAGAVVLAFMVAYAAMFGFDKLREIVTAVPSGNPADRSPNGK